MVEDNYLGFPRHDITHWSVGPGALGETPIIRVGSLTRPKMWCVSPGSILTLHLDMSDIIYCLSLQKYPEHWLDQLMGDDSFLTVAILV